jgi:alkylated DNA repair dioxygenase AlkB
MTALLPDRAWVHNPLTHDQFASRGNLDGTGPDTVLADKSPRRVLAVEPALGRVEAAWSAPPTAQLQGSLFDDDEQVTVRPMNGLIRQELGRGAWIDVLPGWVGGADQLFKALAADVPWQAERRQMYERVVDVPRLLRFYDESEPLPHPSLSLARESLTRHYQAELGEPFQTAGLCLYRDGHDSVAWHGDTIGRGRSEDTMVAILSLGAARALLLRPRGGGATIKKQLGPGDLLVMGGSCQRTWEHAIPKTSRPVGPRISVQFRPSGVR